MQITELLKLTEWFNKNIIENKVAIKYPALYNQMNANIRRNNNQQFIPFESQKESLIESIEGINFQTLSLEQINFLEKLKITELIGKPGVDKIEEILIKNNLDIVSVSRIKQNIRMVQAGRIDAFIAFTPDAYNAFRNIDLKPFPHDTSRPIATFPDSLVCRGVNPEFIEKFNNRLHQMRISGRIKRILDSNYITE